MSYLHLKKKAVPEKRKDGFNRHKSKNYSNESTKNFMKRNKIENIKQKEIRLQKST